MVTVRAALALGLLGGYWVGRRLLLAALLVAAGWAVATGATWRAILITAVTVLAATLSLRADRAVHRCVHRDPVGVPVAPRSDSPLWSEVRSLSGRLRVRAPEEIRVGTEPVIEVWEQSRRLGLVAGPRHLYVGLPLLLGLPAQQLRALLIHELAHDSREAGRFPAICHRARATLSWALPRLSRTAAVGFAATARLFLAVESAPGREQEFRADRIAVRLAGRSSIAGALRELPVLAADWRRYLAEVIEPAVRSGYAPLSIGDGFHHSRRRWDAQPVVPPPESPEPPERPDPSPASWDVHPSRWDRLHAIELAPETSETGPVGWRPDRIPEIRQAERDLLGAEVRRVPWEEFEAIADGETLREEVAQLYRAAGETAGQRGGAAEPDLGTVLELMEARALPDLVERLSPATDGSVRRLLAAAFALAAVDGDVARWRRSSSGALQVVRADGGAVPVEELAARVIADPSTVPMVREALRAVRVAHAQV